MSTPAPAASASGWLRWSRAVVVAAVATTLGVVAHLSAGGVLPSGPSLAVIAGCLTVVAAAALDRPSSRTLVVSLVAGGQAVVHFVLTATAGHTGPRTAIPGGAESLTVAPTTAPPSGTVREALTVVSSESEVVSAAAGTTSWLDHVLADLSGVNAAMAVGHVAAACLVALWLWTGEDALWTLVALLGWRTRVALSLPTTTAVEPTRLDPVPVSIPVNLRWRRAATGGPTGRRGPPMALACAPAAPAA